MILSYGSYSHDDAEVTVRIQRGGNRGPLGVRTGYTERWEINGVKHAADVAALRTALDALEAAYSADGFDLVMRDGSTVTHALYSANTVSGVLVDGPSYPTSEGAEYTTYRTYSITAEAEVEDATDYGVIDFSESVEASGGGPRVVHIETLNGLPVPQTVNQATVYRLVQSGYAVGHKDYPPVPLPVAYAALVENPTIRRTSPGRLGRRGRRGYRVDWLYLMESRTPIAGLPTLPPGF